MKVLNSYVNMTLYQTKIEQRLRVASPLYNQQISLSLRPSHCPLHNDGAHLFSHC